MTLSEHNYFMTLEADYPPIPIETVDKILSWHDSQKILYVDPYVDGVGNPWYYTVIREFNSDALPFNKKTYVRNSIPGGFWNIDFIQKFPEMIKYFNSLPLKKISKIILLELRSNCPAHKDVSASKLGNIETEPGSFRISLRNGSADSFYVRPVRQEDWKLETLDYDGTNYQFDHPKVYWDMEPGKVWLLNNLVCAHGADYNPGDNKVLISIHAQPDDEKMMDLINRSSHMRKTVYPDIS